MKAATQNAEAVEKLSVPWDITEWLDQASLLSRIIEDIDSLDWKNPELERFLRANPNFQPRFLLVLLTYAYARGVCESDEVVELHYRDTELNERLPGQAPSAKAVTRFRREHRGLLKWSIAQALKHALRGHFELEDVPLPPGLRRLLNDTATMRIDVGRHLDRSVQAE